jgi:hypothetical protein
MNRAWTNTLILTIIVDLTQSDHRLNWIWLTVTITFTQGQERDDDEVCNFCMVAEKICYVKVCFFFFCLYPPRRFI